MSPILKPESRSQAPKANVWLIVSVILALLLVATVGLMAYEKMGKNTASKGMTVLSADQAAKDLVTFINEVYGASVGQVTLKDKTDENGLYKITLGVTQNGTPSDQVVYVTKDGKIFIPQVIDIANMREQFKAYQAQQAAQPAAAPAAQPAAEPTVPAPAPAPVQ